MDHVEKALPTYVRTVGSIVARHETQGRGQLLINARKKLADQATQADTGCLTLQIARLRAGLSQEQLAARIGSTQPSVARLEAGRDQNPSLHTLRQLCSALSIDWVRISTLPKFHS